MVSRFGLENSPVDFDLFVKQREFVIILIQMLHLLQAKQKQKQKKTSVKA